MLEQASSALAKERARDALRRMEAPEFDDELRDRATLLSCPICAKLVPSVAINGASRARACVCDCVCVSD